MMPTPIKGINKAPILKGRYKGSVIGMSLVWLRRTQLRIRAMTRIITVNIFRLLRLYAFKSKYKTNKEQ